MTLEELKTLLEDSGKTDIFEKVVDLVNTEKQRGIEEKSKANREAQNLRKFKKALESIGYSDEDDLETFTSEILNKTTKSKDAESLTMKALNQKIQDLTDQIIQEKNTAKVTKLQSKLNEALADKIYGHQYVVKSLITDGKFDMDGDNIVFKDEDSVYDFTTGINKVLENNKDIIKTKQAQGTGTKINGDKPNDIQSILQSNDSQAIKQAFPEIAKELGLKV